MNHFGEYEKCSTVFSIKPSMYKNMYVVDFGENALNTSTKNYLLSFYNLDAKRGIFSTEYSEIIIYSLSIFVLDDGLFRSVKSSPGMTFNFDTSINLTKDSYTWNIDKMNHNEFIEKTKHAKQLIVDKLIWDNNYAKLQYSINGHDKLVINQEQEFLVLELLLGEKNVFYVKINPHNIDAIKFNFTLANSAN